MKKLFLASLFTLGCSNQVHEPNYYLMKFNSGADVEAVSCSNLTHCYADEPGHTAQAQAVADNASRCSGQGTQTRLLAADDILRICR